MTLNLFMKQGQLRYFYEAVKGFENEPEKGLRCNKCFELRLTKTAQKGKRIRSLKIVIYYNIER